ncbi:hypothetical protein [Curtobacterium sp. MCBD17_019]|uniref:hypothetical protein n=1 Tax=Curtobacterium sp. MCBD17_019 TaxID=2175669 RepID=UPI0011B6366F|nr:hypothetical protein [Curtobacterium sp. MCBD17_019]
MPLVESRSTAGRDELDVIHTPATRLVHEAAENFSTLSLAFSIVELARSAVMLGTVFRNWGPVSGSVQQQFLDGYQTVQALTDEELHWWPVLVLWYSLALVPRGDDPNGWGRAAAEVLDGHTAS